MKMQIEGLTNVTPNDFPFFNIPHVLIARVNKILIDART